MTDFYEMGLEPTTNVRGYAVFIGCEGEDPRFRAFLVDKDQAEALASLMRASICDGSVQCELAFLTSDMGLVTANDFEIKTHEELEQRIINARAAGLEVP